MALTREKFYIIVPKAATNLATNPSIELATTGWVAYGSSTLSRTTGVQRRGAASLQVLPDAGTTLSGALTTQALTAATIYSLSADVYCVPGITYRMFLTDASYNVLATTEWTNPLSSNTWFRKSITYTPGSSATYKLIISRLGATTTYFFVDGLQIEVGSESTYFDGDYWGQTLQRDFGWNGTRQASTSYRLARTRAGGTLLDIETYAKIVSHIGLGRPPEQHFTSEINADGELYQATKVMPRDFVINLAFTGDAATIAANRKALLNAMQLDKTPIRQPLVLRYQGVDANGEWMTAPVNIPCVYMGGLERSATTYAAEMCAVQFRMTAPYMEMDGEVGAALGYSTSVTNFANIGYRDTDGIWKAMSTGVNGTVYCMAQGPDGSIYIGGNFLSAGGVANTAYVAKWNGSAFSALSTGTNGTVFAMAFDAAGNLYIGGSFLSAGGVANTVRVAKWNGSAFSALSTGIGSGVVYAIAISKTGNVYIGGSFTNHFDANGDYITMWNGSAFSSLSTGTNGNVRALAFDTAGILYLGGDFLLAGGVSNTSKIASWDNTVFLPLGIGMEPGGGVFAITFDLAGNVLCGGTFTEAGGVANTAYVAKWNRVNWSALSVGMDAGVYTLKYDSNGDLYAGGGFLTAGGVTMPDRIAVWRGNVWQPMDVNVNDVLAAIYSILLINDGRVYIGGAWTGSTATSATTTVANNTGTKAYPEIEIYGPGTIWQIKNYTNGDALYFNNVTLLTGESIFIDCNPFRFRVLSNWRGDIQSTILPGSTNITIEPGNNNISAYLMNSGAGSSINMTWKPTYSSIDEALR